MRNDVYKKKIFLLKWVIMLLRIRCRVHSKTNYVFRNQFVYDEGLMRIHRHSVTQKTTATLKTQIVFIISYLFIYCELQIYKCSSIE